MGLLRSRYRLHVGEYIALPREVIERSCLREGDKVKVVIMRRGVLIIPEGYDLVDLMSGLSPLRRGYDEAEYYEQLGSRRVDINR